MVLPWRSILEAVRSWHNKTRPSSPAAAVRPHSPGSRPGHTAAAAAPSVTPQPSPPTHTPDAPQAPPLALQTARAFLPESRISAGSSPADLSSAVLQASPSTVAVQLGPRSWASGIIVSQGGHILTNAHLFSPSPSHRSATICFPGSRAALPADIVHVFRGPLDVAVLKLRTQLPAGACPVRLAASPAAPGQPVGVLGYPLVRPGLGGGVLASRGNVAKVLSQHRGAHGERQAVLICTAAVHPGTACHRAEKCCWVKG